MFEVLSQKTIIMAPFAFIVYILSAIALGWILYGLRGYKVWARRFHRYENHYVPNPRRVARDYFPSRTRTDYAHSYARPLYHDISAPQPTQSEPMPYYAVQPDPVVLPQDNTINPFPSYSTKDDLKVIEGIGPKIEEILNNNGIYTWNELAQTPAENIRVILDRAGKQYQIHDPKSWPYQADLAHKGDWKGLEDYQNHLHAGRE